MRNRLAALSCTGCMTNLGKTHYFRMAGLAAGAVAVGGAALIVTASASGLSLGFRPAGSSQPQGAGTTADVQAAAVASSVCNDFLGHFAGELGKSQSAVDAAFQKAIGETLADEVKNGKLTQAQADAIKAKLAGKAPCTLAGSLGPRAGSGAAAPAAGAYMQQLVAAAASALGISAAQLRTDLMTGMSLSQIAAAQNPPVSEATFRTRLIAALKPMLDGAVSNGKLTSTQEQAILQRLQTGRIPFWNAPIRRKPAPPATSPSPSTT